MSLLALQSRFRAGIAAGDDNLPPSSPGMAIYRDAYRGRLMGALETRFARTRRWAGEEAFTAAAQHHVLDCPPARWTLDSYGAEFPELLERLFRENPEVAELAWLEWHMAQAFAAPDRPPLDREGLASAGLTDSDWDALGFEMAAGFAHRPVSTDCGGLFAALADHAADDAAEPLAPGLPAGHAVVVWRPRLTPHFRTLEAAEHRALGVLADGGTLGAIGETSGPVMLGGWLTQWLGEGMFSAWRIHR